jgi:hypothetical protein
MLSKKLSGAFNFRAGFTAAIIAGTCAATVAAIGAAVLYNGGTYLQSAVWPVLGCGTIFGCAAGAAYVRRPRRRFVASLIIVALSSIIATAVINSSRVMPRNYKSAYHPILYPEEAIALVSPPIITALILILLPSKRKEPPIVA